MCRLKMICFRFCATLVFLYKKRLFVFNPAPDDVMGLRGSSIHKLTAGHNHCLALARPEGEHRVLCHPRAGLFFSHTSQ
jgi:hypothetical protein